MFHKAKWRWTNVPYNNTTTADISPFNCNYWKVNGESVGVTITHNTIIVLDVGIDQTIKKTVNFAKWRALSNICDPLLTMFECLCI